MNKIQAFAVRNFKEIVRDPLSYIFCLGFPLVMLVIMSLVNDSIPPEAGMTIFRIDNLAGGIAVFGLTFLMLFICLTVAKDRAGAFLVRLYASPMKSWDFILGYVVSTSVLGILQLIAAFAASFIVSLVTGINLNIGGLLLAVVTLLPTMLLLISCGLLFGTLFSEKAAPGLCSIIISFASFLGGVWFDAESTGGVLLKICNALPFFHAVKAARLACALDFGDYLTHLLITIAYAAAVTAAAVIVFSQKMRADLQ